MEKKKVAFYTLGCKLNFSESSSLARSFLLKGYGRVEFHEKADVYVINTCSVTDHADKKCAKVVKQALKNSPGAIIAVIGCYAQLKPEEIASIPGVSIVLGASEKFNLPEHIENHLQSDETRILAGPIKHVHTFVPSFSAGDRTRSFLKVQDGCDYFCSFCTIPLARGQSRSDTIQNTLNSAKKAIETGVKEIVLTGVNIGDFGSHPDENFFKLVQELDKLQGINRFRISSIEPNLLTDEIIHFVSNSQHFVPHFHIPLQSGSNKILKLMRRKYDVELYENRILYIKSLMPNCAIGVDVITGFPGETEEDFLETYQFLNRLDITYLHVFTYSERENTTAVKLSGSVPKEERLKRTHMLRILSEKKRRFFYEQHLGLEAEVLFEAEENTGMMNGFTENYIRVKTAYDPSLLNQIKKVRLNKIDGDGEVLIEEIPIFQS